MYLGASGDGVLGYTSFVYSPIVSLATGGSVSSVVGVGIDWASVLRGALPELAGVIVARLSLRLCACLVLRPSF